DGRLQHQAAAQAVSGKRASKSPIEKPPRGIFFPQFASLNEAACKMHSVLLEAQRADHAVAVEPVAIALSRALEPRRAIDVVVPAQPLRHVSSDPGDLEGVFDRIEQ